MAIQRWRRLRGSSLLLIKALSDYVSYHRAKGLWRGEKMLQNLLVWKCSRRLAGTLAFAIAWYAFTWSYDISGSRVYQAG